MKKTLSTKWFLFTENDFSIGNNMPEKNLKKLMTGVEATDSLGDFNRQINHIAFDSRKVCEGGLFVAIPGEKFNGETFIKDALDKGAIAIITESPLNSLSSISIDSEKITVFGLEIWMGDHIESLFSSFLDILKNALNTFNSFKCKL